MALSYIWSGFFLVGFAAALAQWLFMGDVEVFKRIIDGTFTSAKVAVMDIALPLAGAIEFVAKLIGPFFSRIFPEVPRNHPASGHMVMNFSANFLGLDNAATPFGLKAMDSLQSLNPNKEEASDAQIMFLVLQTSGLTLIPLSIIAQRAILGAQDPSDVFLPILIATYVATVVALVSVSIRQRINLFDSVILGWVGGITALIGGMVWYLVNFMTRTEIELFSKLASNLVLAGIIAVFLIGAHVRPYRHARIQRQGCPPVHARLHHLGRGGHAGGHQRAAQFRCVDLCGQRIYLGVFALGIEYRLHTRPAYRADEASERQRCTRHDD